MTQPLLSIEDLATAFPGEEGDLFAVDGVDLDIMPGEVLGLVGESGSGKSMTALSVMGLVPHPGRVVSGRALFNGDDLIQADEDTLRKVRGAQIGMIFQEPMTSLNPVFTVGRQVAEGLITHGLAGHKEAWERAVEALDKVGIPDAARRARSYPHQLSGGMRQRVMIAGVLALSPQLVIADEPTTALDVTIQAQILRLMDKLREETGASILFITHNLAVVAETCERVAVMYAGRLVELAEVEELFDEPLHPYTKGLISCLPARAHKLGEPLTTIPGVVPALDALPPGCAFSDRCPEVFDRCRQAEPALAPSASGRRVRCYLHHSQPRQRKRRAA